MLKTTAHEQLRRTSPAKGYVAGRCDAAVWIGAGASGKAASQAIDILKMLGHSTAPIHMMLTAAEPVHAW